MLVKDKVIAIFGGSGAIGSAVAHAMAREGDEFTSARVIARSWIEWRGKFMRRAAGARPLSLMSSMSDRSASG